MASDLARCGERGHDVASAADLSRRHRPTSLPPWLIRPCPSRARVRTGWTDVVLLERDRLTSGTTWHAAGLMVTFGSTSETSTEMRKYTRDLYARLEAETGLSTGFKPVGFIEVAADATGSRSTGGSSAFNRYCGVDVHEISAGEVKRAVPAGPHRRHPRRLLRRRGRPGQPGRRHDGAGQGRAHGGVDDRRGRAGHRRAQRARRGHRRAHRVRRHRGRVRRQLRRHVGAPARREGRREHPAAGGRALLPDHRADRGVSPGRGRCSRTRRRTATSARRSAA